MIEFFRDTNTRPMVWPVATGPAARALPGPPVMGEGALSAVARTPAPRSTDPLGKKGHPPRPPTPPPYLAKCERIFRP
jgi:hypothetical protein